MKNRKNARRIVSKASFKGLSVLQQVKAARKESREEEIRLHGKPLNIKGVVLSKKIYKRKSKRSRFDTEG